MIRVATRKSPLAMRQTQMLIDSITPKAADTFELVPLLTQGDRNITDRFEKLGGKGVFTKELDDALLTNRADIAVHSLKDLPSQLPDDIELIGVGLEQDSRDVWVSEKYERMEDVPSGEKVGTSSARRIAQLHCHHPDLQAHPIRGNLQTRLEKMKNEGLAGMILAASGLIRMGFEHHIRSYLPLDQFIPAPGQGVLAITAKGGKAFEFLSSWQNHQVLEKHLALREIMKRLDGGCSVPLGIAWTDQDELLTFVANPKGTKIIQHSMQKQNTYQETALKMLSYLETQGVQSLLQGALHGR